MTKANDIYSWLNSFAPVETQESFDNAGFLFGDREKPVTKVLMALDATSEVIDEAEEKGAEMIVTHHPLIFGSLKNVLPENTTGRKLLSLAKKDLCVVSMHTNLDKAEGGVNDSLINALGCEKAEAFPAVPFMRIGYLVEELPMKEFLLHTKKALNSNGLRYYDAGRPVKKIACIGGQGGDWLYDAHNAACDTFVTADVKYHLFLDAKELGINLIDADHFCTENPVMQDMKNRLQEAFPAVEFILSERHHQTAEFI